MENYEAINSPKISYSSSGYPPMWQKFGIVCLGWAKIRDLQVYFKLRQRRKLQQRTKEDITKKACDLGNCVLLLFCYCKGNVVLLTPLHLILNAYIWSAHEIGYIATERYQRLPFIYQLTTTVCHTVKNCLHVNASVLVIQQRNIQAYNINTCTWYSGTSVLLLIAYF